MLYPSSLQQFSSSLLLNAGSLHYFILQISQNQIYTLISANTNLQSQDYAIRVWVSEQINGIPVGKYWNMHKANSYPQMRTIGNNNTCDIITNYKTYYVNCLNMTMEPQTYSFTIGA